MALRLTAGQIAQHRPGGIRETKQQNERKMKITINNVRNANELDEFYPVEGQWHVDGAGDRSRAGVEQSVLNWMDAPYEINVHLFTTNGHEIVNDLPADGTFLATRK